jgi:hypothetical protein
MVAITMAKVNNATTLFAVQVASDSIAKLITIDKWYIKR